MNSYLLVLGASVVDIFGFSRVKYQAQNSTPGAIKMSFGGVCRNIAENMARMGLPVKFISVLGNDEKGRSMLEHSRLLGYDMSESLVLEKGRTPTYMAILNEKGEMMSAIVDMDSMDELDIDFIKEKAPIIKGAEYTFLDADNPEILAYILETFSGMTKFILDPISAAKADTIKHLIHHFHTIKPNRHEAEVLCGFPINSDEDLKLAGHYFISMGIKEVFISLDEEGIFYMNQEACGRVKALDVPVKNVTGAGDSFVAGLGYGYHHQLPLLETVKFSMAMSIMTISYEETIHPKLCLETVKRTIEEVDWIEYEL